MKSAYDYLFYKLYRFAEAAPSKWMSEWKASLTLDVLIAFFLFSILNYYSYLQHHFVNIGDGKSFVLLLILVVCIPNYFIFNHKERWKIIIRRFDGLPKNKNRIGGIAVLIFVLIMLSNIFVSFYLLSFIKNN